MSSGIASACAQGEQVGKDEVALFHVPDASMALDASHAGTGGKGQGGSTGSGGASSGGTPIGSGGSGTGGRGAGGSAEDSGGSEGRTGGAPSMGGSGTGGRASGGASGSGTGGASGSGTGGKATGGMMATGGSGGTAGSGGAGGGSGGAMQCPNYTTSTDCSKCNCMHCASQIAQCFASSDQTKNDQCEAIEQCAEMNHCSGQDCYCGTAVLCFPAPAGKCITPINAAAGGNPTPTQVQTFSMDTTHPIGRASAIGTCSLANCKTECGL